MWGRRPGRPGRCQHSRGAPAPRRPSEITVSRESTRCIEQGSKCMEIVVKGRRTEVSERFRRHVLDKLAKLERWDGKIVSVDVEVAKERNPRLTDVCERVEITCVTRGSLIRA